MLFDSWDSIGRMVVFGIAAYAGAIAMLRISGSRTLSKMNAFDLVVTIAFGSTLSAILIDGSLSLATGIGALALLIVLQFVVAALAVRSGRFRNWITTQPVLLAWGGHVLDDAMRQQRVAIEDIEAALRQRGFARLDQVMAVVLEADGSLSVVESAGTDGAARLSGMQVPPQ
ncbi:DUF421 domain-containing protein [Massilia soli]|uniref:DUF421 domain-containing protein n=1 Tax=Massilia soli TaxID=2792854 RepID=A0ABS7SUX8_9BURK|nr:YetF domain-containing protein [Massilia soli]MBZ2209763.1 DUF421 domain-containing protein [Massilia soli]